MHYCAYKTSEFTRQSVINSRSQVEMLLKTSQLQYNDNIIPVSCFSFPSAALFFKIKPSKKEALWITARR